MENSDFSKLPLDTLGVKSLDGQRIFEAVEKITLAKPNSQISVQDVSQSSGIDTKNVKNVLYLLFSYGMLKATFLPVHKKCGNAIGKQEESTEIILKKISLGDIDWCVYCSEPINNHNNVQVQIILWKLGVNIKNGEYDVRK